MRTRGEPSGPIVIGGKCTVGKSHLALLAARDAATSGQSVFWVAPWENKEDLPTSVKQVFFESVGDIFRFFLDKHPDMIVIDSYECFTGTQRHVYAFGQSLFQATGARVIITNVMVM